MRRKGATFLADIREQIRNCDLCRARFAITATQHRPRPVAWFRPTARILIAGQAPGMRVHQSGVPFDDRSGDRLRSWMGVGRDQFYDQSQIAVVPMAFCFPGYDSKGSDLPPPKICAHTWRDRVLETLPNVELTLLVGGYALNWHFGKAASVRDHVMRWEDHAPQLYPLPHPSWRNTAWLKANPWFEADHIPHLQAHVQKVLNT